MDMYVGTFIYFLGTSLGMLYSVRLYRDCSGAGPCGSAVFCMVLYHSVYIQVSELYQLCTEIHSLGLIPQCRMCITSDPCWG